jgi:hypothetical protein
MEALNLDPKRPRTRQLRASEFPERADVYVCDKCGRDITAHLYPGSAHVQPPLGPLRYICRCGQKYLSGAAEWDDLGNWEKRHRLGDIGLVIIVSAALAAFSILVHLAVARRSIALFVLLATVILFSAPLFPLLIAILAIPFEIAASLWRTRVIGASYPK